MYSSWGGALERQVNPTRVARQNVWQVLGQRPSRLAQGWRYGTLCYGWREMLCVVCEEPVRLTGYGREQHGDVRLVPDQVSTGVNQRPLGAGNLLRIGQLDEAAVIPDQIIRVQGREVFGMQQQVFFDLFSDDFRQNKSAYPGRTDRQHSFIEAPRRDDPSGEHVRIQKKPDSPTAGHFTRGLRREPRFTALVGL